MDYHRVNVGREGKPYVRKRRDPAPYLDDVPRLTPKDEFSEADNFFVVEQALVDGTLPEPSLKWEADSRWIAPYQWDMLIYMWSNADIARTSVSFSGLRAAGRYCGLNRDIRGQRKEQGRRKRELFVGLEKAGLMEEVRRSAGGRKVYRQLKLAPVWLREGPVPSDKPRTWANLSASDRKWFKMALRPFTQPQATRRRCAWAELGPIDKRVLAALYLHFNDKEFGAVDPNHVCLRGEELVISEAFRLAVGRSVDADQIAESLGELWRRFLLAFMTASFSEDKPHPGSPAHIRYATREATGDDAVVCLRYVPKRGDPGSPDG